MRPVIRVGSLRKTYDDGNHNAFTDLCRFRGRIYLAFRSCPDGHMIFATSRIVVMESLDGREWKEVFRFHVPDRDVRDPHFLVLRDTLFVYSGTWPVTGEEGPKHELNENRGYGVWSTDGSHWEGPRYLEGTQGHYVWRAAAFGGHGYLNGRRKKDFAVLTPKEREWEIAESHMLRTSDGLRFESVGVFQESFGDETAFLFEEDGSVVAVARNRDRNRAATLCRSRPPYREWVRTPLVRNVGGPMIAKWEGRYLVGGRRFLDRERAVTVLYWLEGEELREALELPSGGDNSYPGFLPLGPGRGLLSYYSSHEGSGTSLAPCAVYLAELSL